ncbi:hypothetical protein [Pseudoxanthomonas sp. 10H]|uniref:hypothetical protein n=1 Tax=Pseudoxanthomonas sp. 10H TaxID=3242729 RepID=UPI0035578EE0
MSDPYQGPSIVAGASNHAAPAVPYLKSWLLFFLIATVGGGLIGMVMGAIGGIVMGSMGMPVVQIGLVTGALGFIIGIPISFFSFRWSVARFIVAPLQQRT